MPLMLCEDVLDIVLGHVIDDIESKNCVQRRRRKLEGVVDLMVVSREWHLATTRVLKRRQLFVRLYLRHSDAPDRALAISTQWPNVRINLIDSMLPSGHTVFALHSSMGLPSNRFLNSIQLQGTHGTPFIDNVSMYAGIQSVELSQVKLTHLPHLQGTRHLSVCNSDFETIDDLWKYDTVRLRGGKLRTLGTPPADQQWRAIDFSMEDMIIGEVPHALPRCRTLQLRNLVGPMVLPGELMECRALLLYKIRTNNLSLPKCKNLRMMSMMDLPLSIDLPSLECVELQDIDDMSYIPRTLHCATMDIRRCSGLRRIQSSVCTSLVLKSCMRLRNIAALPFCVTFDIEHCSSVRTINSLPAVKFMSVRDCFRLRRIGNLPKVEKLHLARCHSLRSIHDNAPMQQLKCGSYMHCNTLSRVTNDMLVELFYRGLK